MSARKLLTMSFAAVLLTACGGKDDFGLSSTDKNIPFHVGFTAASAEICGVTVDTEGLRKTMMDYETANGRKQLQLDGIGANYDQVVATTKAKLANDPEYCTDERKEKITADVAKYSIGDFSGL